MVSIWGNCACLSSRIVDNRRLSKKGEVRNAVKIALQMGYTHIDCAHIYGNEDEIGQGIKDWGGDRKTIWITSKVLHPSLKVDCGSPVLDGSNGSCGIMLIVRLMYRRLWILLWKTCKRSILTCIALSWDLTNERYLMHWPVAFVPGKENIPKDKDGKILLDDVPYTEVLSRFLLSWDK